MKWILLFSLLLTLNSLFRILYIPTVPVDIVFATGMDSAIYGTIALNPWTQIFEKAISPYAPDYYALRVLPAVIVHYGLRLFNQEINPSSVVFGFQILNWFSSLGIFLFLVALIKQLFGKNDRYVVFSLGVFFASPLLLRSFYFYPVMNDAFACLVTSGILWAYFNDRKVFLTVFSLMGAFTWSLFIPVGVSLLLFSKRSRLPIVQKQNKLNGFSFIAVILVVIAYIVLFFLSLFKPYSGITFSNLNDRIFWGLFFSALLLAVQFYKMLEKVDFSKLYFSEIRSFLNFQNIFLVVLVLIIPQAWVAWASPARTMGNLIPLSYAVGAGVRAPGGGFVSLLPMFGFSVVLLFVNFYRWRELVYSYGTGYFLSILGLSFLLFDTEARHHLIFWIFTAPAFFQIFKEQNFKRLVCGALLGLSIIYGYFINYAINPDDVHGGINFYYMNPSDTVLTFGSFVVLYIGFLVLSSNNKANKNILIL